MGKKILTLDNLYQFFVEQNKTFNFNSKESGTSIVVSVPGNFEVEENDMPGMLKTKLKVCHTKLNRNGSNISEENMEKAMPTLKYRPILAHIHQLDDGTWDFYAHNMEIVEDEDGNEQINYIEKQVGCFTADDPYLEYDKKQDKTYVMAYGVIPENYTKAADIIRTKNGTKVSCELVINELSYNAKEKYLDLTDFYFGGTTLLGRDEEGNEIGEGMLGARLDIEDFCHAEPNFNYQDKLIEALEKLNYTLENFHKTSTEEGGRKDMDKFNELLEKYGKTAEDVTFEIEGLTDEELEAKFAELFEENESDDNSDGEGDGSDGDDNSDDGNEEGNDGEGDSQSAEDEVFTKTFTVELSHDDIRNALYTLVKQYENDDEYYYIREVFDSYFVMQDWWNNKIYKQNYARDGENVSLDGDRIEVFEILVTAEEKSALEALKENYSDLESKYNELKEFKENYDATELHNQREAVLGADEYSVLAENEEFKKLTSEMDKYSVEELKVKADLVFAAHIKASGEFSVKKEETNKSKTLGFNFEEKASKKKKAYGSLFDN